MKSVYIGSFSFLITLLLWGSCVGASPPQSPNGVFHHNDAGFLSTNYYNGQQYAKQLEGSPPSYFLLNSWYNTSETIPREYGFGHLLIGFKFIEEITYYVMGCTNGQSVCTYDLATDVSDDITVYLGLFDAKTSSVGTIIAQATTSLDYRVVNGNASFVPITFSFGHVDFASNTEYVLYFKNNSINHIQFLSNADHDLAPALLLQNGVFVRTYGDNTLLPLYFDLNETSVGVFSGDVYITTDEILNNDPHWFLADLSLPQSDDKDAVPVSANSTEFELYFFNNRNTSFTIKDITIFVKAPFISNALPVIVYGEIELSYITGRNRDTRTTGDTCIAVITTAISDRSFTQVDFTCGNGTIIPENTTYTFRVDTRQWFKPYALAGTSNFIAFQGGQLLFNTYTAYTWVYENGTGTDRYVSGNAIRYEINPFVCKHGESRGCNDCKCYRGFDVGYWGGEDCSVCAINFYGIECNKYCNANKTCHGNGTCDLLGDCLCVSGFTGLHCESAPTTTIISKRATGGR